MRVERIVAATHRDAHSTMIAKVALEEPARQLAWMRTPVNV